MRRILVEDKVTDYIKKAIVNNCMFDKATLSTAVSELPENIQKRLHDSAITIYNSCIKNNQNLLMYFRRFFLSTFDINYGKGPVEYAIGLARIAIIELGMFKGNSVGSEISSLKQTVLFLHNSSDQALKSQYDGNLNGLNYTALMRQLTNARKAFNKANRERLSSMVPANPSDYTVVAINSQEDAAKYASYTKWCITYLPNQYEKYTQGGRRFYFCLKKGFENVPKQIGEGCPLDEYGLSMIAVLVSPEGEPDHITTRWNHENDGEDNENLKTAEQLQKVTGLNFYNVFKPYTFEELQKMGVTPFYAVQDLLDQGVIPERIFNSYEYAGIGIYRVQLNDKYNYIVNRKKILFPDQWFYWAGDFCDDVAVLEIELNNKFNYTDLQGKILFPNQNFDWALDFKSGFGEVQLNDKWTLVKNNGSFLSPNLWFDEINWYNGGYWIVELNDRYNIINSKGSLLSPNLWFDYATGGEGDPEVKLSNDSFLLNDKGQLCDIETKQPIQSLQESKKKKKKPSAQAQVGNKVNSGLMNAICYGGLEESNPDFYIGAEKNNHDFCHVTKGSAAPLNESFNLTKDEYKKFFKSIGNYMNTHGLTVKPFPSIQLNNDEQDGLFIYTGYYAPNEKKVVLFTNGRHPKDILRSFAHEMVHHAQNLRGENLSFTNDDNVKDNQSLEKLEAEAYLQGNLYFRKWTEYFKNGEQDMLNESVDEYLKPDEVDLSSFKPKTKLNPKFWVGNHLDSRIRMRLLNIAEDFIRFMDVDWAEPVDIILTGSLAGINYDERYSDIDLHIIFDYSDINDNKELVDNYFYSQKKLWNDEHKDLSIYGFPVEVFVEDSKSDSKGAVYSLMRDKWIDEPDTEKQNDISPEIKQSVRKKVSEYTKIIDRLMGEFNKGKDNEYILRKLSEKVNSLFKKIKQERQSGLEKSEYSEGNLVFKSLRRNGYLAQLIDLKKKIYDKSHSLP